MPANQPSASSAPAAKTARASDRKTLAAVRRVVVKEKSLSVSAHNVKMKMTNGTLLLRGGVKTAEEKDRIEALAKGVAGVASVDNQLTLKGMKTARATTARTATTDTTAPSTNAVTTK
jgi:hyperosmotically inducible protein